MKPLLFIVFFLLSFMEQRTDALWYIKVFKAKGLDKKYQLSSFLQPTYIRADFNGDSLEDVALTITEKSTNRKGILLIHKKSNNIYIFGAGTNFGSGGNNFKWIDRWGLYNNKTASEAQFDEATGDMIDGKEIKLNHPGILLEDHEDGAFISGGILYWNGKNYSWIHQGE
ncbi:hypothetical protein [Fibrella aquatilis]|uniref:Uncharacterized protein n=1 Tax=Fibrella aquatilis TaxID=2817059 RepID=A0A939G5R7_9BACT|nr:hypothetical protein [Fibrella aquatilis]MBO0930722.1 hypothetical protein [Fibrella aquatilis]